MKVDDEAIRLNAPLFKRCLVGRLALNHGKCCNLKND